MKKLIVVIFCAAIFTINLFATPLIPINKPAAELYGGGAYMLMTKYNEDIADAAAGLAALSFTSDLYETNLGLDISIISLGIMENVGQIGMIAPYLKAEFILAGDSDSEVYYPGGKTYALYEIDLSTAYIGLGLRKYFADKWEINALLPFAAIDLGTGFSYSAKYSITYYDTAGKESGYSNIPLSGVYFGTCLEGGANYWFSEAIGVSGVLGFRYMNAGLAGTATGSGDGAAIDGEEITKEVDYTGFYAGIGVTFSFMPYVQAAGEAAMDDPLAGMEMAMPEQELQGAETFEELYALGSKAYSAKDYRSAAGYLKKAAALKENADVYKKLGYSNYYLKNKAEAKEAFKIYLKLNPSDKKMKAWLDKYK
jgi:tetratricopeptide (TPR) repeat protein